MKPGDTRRKQLISRVHTVKLIIMNDIAKSSRIKLATTKEGNTDSEKLKQ